MSSEAAADQGTYGTIAALSAMAVRPGDTAATVPALFRYSGFRFFFYSNEGNPQEPVHVHVRAGGSEAKLWLEPEIRVVTSYGFDAAALREWVEVAQANREMIERTWRNYFG